MIVSIASWMNRIIFFLYVFLSSPLCLLTFNTGKDEQKR